MTPRIRTALLTAALVSCVALPASAEDGPAAPPPKPAAPSATTTKTTATTRPVDLAICLDTSGSMDGLIDAAKQKLWAIVNDLALAEPTPLLRVALVTFGNDGHVAENGWVKVETGLTTDLDLVSDKLFQLTTNGGTELVGRALHTAARELAWSKDASALKLLIVAGNESADQDTQVRYADACKDAIARGVVVNSIYCGAPTSEDAEGWRQVARLADGHFATIDKDQGTVVVSTPYDESLTKLSTALNATYVPYGTGGDWNRDNQVRQDANASGLNREAAAGRAVMKCGVNYRNDNWDLVDAVEREDFDLAKLADDELPEALRPLDLAGRKAYLAKKRAERTKLRKEMQALAAKRSAYVQETLEKGALSEDRAFDFAVRKAIRAQAAAKGFSFKSGTAAR